MVNGYLIFKGQDGEFEGEYENPSGNTTKSNHRRSQARHPFGTRFESAVIGIRSSGFEAQADNLSGLRALMCRTDVMGLTSLGCGMMKSDSRWKVLRTMSYGWHSINRAREALPA